MSDLTPTQTPYHFVAHELKTPLTAVHEYLALVLDEIPGPITSAQRDCLQTASRNCELLQRYIDDLFDLSRQDVNQLSLVRKPCHINEIFDQVIRTYDLELESKAVNLYADFELNLPKVVVDPERITQVLINLINNAIKFTPEGGDIRLSAALDELGTQMMIAVSDTGSGIAAEDLSLIFERFAKANNHTTKAQREGLGLGLSLCAQIVQSHGGQIDVRSALGVGSQFSFTLPLAKEVVHEENLNRGR